ncbi:phosphoesterase [Geomonas limicola]|uniref:Phosphoesterase n=1 Tax=Geomonas limicola TaxID=2740186 RepID=A0A6V8ND28_9BACT|nr:metallophosphoesterase [Geomonas limicola]GFO70538.1 phosphoesterase [Geomonas limicola]
MRILVISDSHGNFPLALKAHELAGPVDHIIHLGDGADDAELLAEVLEVPVLRVAGNCDFDASLPRELILEIGPCRVLATHGNHQGVKSGLSFLIERGIEVGAGVILYGHTHLPAVQIESGMLLVNPGTLKQGFPASYAILTVQHGEPRAELFNI